MHLRESRGGVSLREGRREVDMVERLYQHRIRRRRAARAHSTSTHTYTNTSKQHPKTPCPHHTMDPQIKRHKWTCGKV